MKTLKIMFLTLSLLGIGVAFSACGGSSHADEMKQQTKEYTSAYVCPMHCEGSGSEEPGKCPVCGMEYVENESHNSEGAAGHEGHDH
ncbi:MAG: heavy metal-binding domain-containing protein [Lewinella sp.]|jgi:hypothetical protein|uniref:heavy metal-binding domain-containing protein n=1 Tax=Lewinella TaxID=70994 RepID=UPI00037D33C7|nr:heavy metal-binding domain-containing protein [Lewinella cohaerens]